MGNKFARTQSYAIRIFFHFINALLITSFLAACNGEAPQKSSNSIAKRKNPLPVKTNSGISMIYLPGGTFTMGDDSGPANQRPAHRVTVSPFLIDMHEVTHEMFESHSLPNPSHFTQNKQQPVEQVRWRDAKRYCNERSIAEGLTPCYDEHAIEFTCDFSANGYRLPTEAEWEYAARAGTRRAFDFGSNRKLNQYAYFKENSGNQTNPVRSRKPNSWGIYGMYGNVSEWCQDVYDPNYYHSSIGNNPFGPPENGTNRKRVIRGGSWKSPANQCSSTFRQGQKTGDTDACFLADTVGFRCVRRITQEELEKML